MIIFYWCLFLSKYSEQCVIIALFDVIKGKWKCLTVRKLEELIFVKYFNFLLEIKTLSALINLSTIMKNPPKNFPSSHFLRKTKRIDQSPSKSIKSHQSPDHFQQDNLDSRVSIRSLNDQKFPLKVKGE